jgi:hypothetical protein
MEKLDLDFNYLIFQPNPNRDTVNFFIDGEKIKRIYRLDKFYKLIYNKVPNLIGEVQKVCNTYSFYLLSIPDRTVVRLVLKAKDALYKDSIAAYISGTVPEFKKEKTTIIDNLSMFGFNVPDENSIKNLQTVISKKPENEGPLARFFVKSKSPMKNRGF